MVGISAAIQYAFFIGFPPAMASQAARDGGPSTVVLALEVFRHRLQGRYETVPKIFYVLRKVAREFKKPGRVDGLLWGLTG